MSPPHTHIVLAINDPALRSFLAAELGMAGELLITTSNHLDPNLTRAVRERALLVIEACLIVSGAADWAEELRGNHWSGRTIVLVELDHALSYDDEEIYFVFRQSAAVDTVELVLKWRLEKGQST